MFVNGVYPGKSLKTIFCESWKILEFLSLQALENSVLMSVRTLLVLRLVCALQARSQVVGDIVAGGPT